MPRYMEASASSSPWLSNTFIFPCNSAGGSKTAALFLEEFFDKEIKWAHIDIAGTCWTDKNKGINPSGATGFGVKTLVQWIKNK